MPQNKIYTTGIDIIYLQNELREFFETSQYQVNLGGDPSGQSITVQAQKRVWNLPGLLGSTSALTVKAIVMSNGIEVNVYGQKYTELIVAVIIQTILVSILGGMTGGLLCFAFPILIIPALAMIEQYRITGRTWTKIDSQMGAVRL